MVRLFAHPVGSCFAKFETGHTYQDFCCSVRSPKRSATIVCVVVQFYPWFKFYFLLFLGMVMYDNEFETKENKI